VDRHPPVITCLSAVRRAEVMILIVGDSYGSLPQGEELSYTHLEYRAALDEKHPTIVVPFLIGSGAVDAPADPRLGRWRQEILDNHTPGIYQLPVNEDEVADTIFQWALKPIIWTRPESMIAQPDQDDADAGINTHIRNYLSEKDRATLEREESSAVEFVYSSNLKQLENLSEILKRPAEVAANEQIREAEKAMGLADRNAAATHYRRALELRPMDFRPTYELARLLAASGSKKGGAEALELALKAAQMAQSDRRLIRSAEAYMLAAQSAALIGSFPLAVECASGAVEVAPWLAAAHYEKSCQHINNLQETEAVQELMTAFRYRPQIMAMRNDQYFTGERRALARRVAEAVRTALQQKIDRLLRISGRLLQELQGDAEAAGTIKGYIAMIRETKNSYKALDLSREYILAILPSIKRRFTDLTVSYTYHRLKSIQPVAYKVAYTYKQNIHQNEPLEIDDDYIHDHTGSYVEKGAEILKYRTAGSGSLVQVVTAENGGVIEKYCLHGKAKHILISVCEKLIETPADPDEVADPAEFERRFLKLADAISDLENVISYDKLFHFGVNYKYATAGDLACVDIESIEPKSSYLEKLCPEDAGFDPKVIASVNANKIGGRFRMAVACQGEGGLFFSRSALYFSK